VKLMQKDISESVRHRFWAKVDIQDGPERPGELGPCWSWLAYTMPNGYGTFQISRGLVCLAHRLAWILVSGEIPTKRAPFVLHRCDFRRCVRFDRLFVGTQAENLADMRRKGRQASGDRHGSRVHPERVRRGEDHRNALVNEAIVRDMRMRYESGGALQRELADELGLTIGCVQGIVTYRTWRHVQ
jgi:hypothetical protein